MLHRQKLYGGIIGFIGFLLSPFSWWNDLFINFPLAYLGAWLVSLIYRQAFLTAFVVSYWLTNILGLILMQKGASDALNEKDRDKVSSKNLLRDVIILLFYTILIIILVKLHIIQPIGDYFTV